MGGGEGGGRGGEEESGGVRRSQEEYRASLVSERRLEGLLKALFVNELLSPRATKAPIELEQNHRFHLPLSEQHRQRRFVCMI